MRNFLRSALAASLIALALPAMHPAIAQVATSQDASLAALDGDWEGALDVGGTQLHLVLEIKTADGKTEAVLVSIDQNGARLPTSSIARTDGGFTFQIVQIDGLFTGKLAADGNTVDGTWSQSGNDLPLTLSRKGA